jgi:hypothetical protein
MRFPIPIILPLNSSIMNAKVINHPALKVPAIVLAFFFLTTQTGFSQDTFFGYPVTLSSSADSTVSLTLSSYQAFDFDMSPFHDSLHNNTQDYEFTIQIDTLYEWDFVLSQTELLPLVYLAREHGDSLISITTNNHFTGNTVGGGGGTVLCFAIIHLLLF